MRKIQDSCTTETNHTTVKQTACSPINSKGKVSKGATKKCVLRAIGTPKMLGYT
jgi:hypothetical protein